MIRAISSTHHSDVAEFPNSCRSTPLLIRCRGASPTARRTSQVSIFALLIGLILFLDVNPLLNAQGSKDVEIRLKKALAAIEKHDEATAERELKLVLDLDPHNADAYIARGILFYRQGKFADAQEALRRGLAFRPGDQRAVAFQALTRASMGQCQEALPALKKLMGRFEKGDLQRWTGLGLVQCQLSLDQTEDAAATIQRLEQLYPHDPDTLYQAAQVYLALWDRSVLELFMQAPDSWQFHRISGEVLESQGRFSDAAIEYRKAISLNPRVPGLHFRLGRCLMLFSHDISGLDQAQEQFTEELAVNPLDSSSHYELGQIAWTKHDRDAAFEQFERASELNPELVEAFVGVAKVFLEKKEPQKAIPILETAVRRAPNNEAARYEMMIAYRDAGRIEDAKRAQEELEKIREGEQEAAFGGLKKRWQWEEKKPPGGIHP